MQLFHFIFNGHTQNTKYKIKYILLKLVHFFFNSKIARFYFWTSYEFIILDNQHKWMQNRYIKILNI